MKAYGDAVVGQVSKTKPNAPRRDWVFYLQFWQRCLIHPFIGRIGLFFIRFLINLNRRNQMKDQDLTTNLGKLSRLPLNSGLLFMVKTREIAVFRTENDEIFAVENRSTNGERQLYRGTIEDGVLIAPHSGTRFNLKDGDSLDSHDYVTVYSIWVEDGNIYLEFPTFVVSFREILSLVN